MITKISKNLFIFLLLAMHTIILGFSPSYKITRIESQHAATPMTNPLPVSQTLDRTKYEIRSLFCARSFVRVGKRGVRPNHLRSLAELIAYHGVVKVKISDYRRSVDEVVEELSEADNVKLLSIHRTGRFLLFEQKISKPPPPKMRKYDTRVEKTCWECGEVGHVAYDCMKKIRKNEQHKQDTTSV